MFSPEFLTEEFADFLHEWENDNDFVAAHTSGSTGKPKRIELPKSDMIISAKATNEFFGIDDSSVLYCPLSSQYIAGKMMLVRALTADCKLIVETPSNSLFKFYGCTDAINLLAIVPSQVESVINFIESGGKIENIIIGGAPLESQNERRLCNYPVKVYVTYGMTETSSHVALRKIGNEIYSALPGITFATGEDSRLIIKSDQMSFGSLMTNDIVELLSPQQFIWKGRADNVINTGGIKVHPEELERILSPKFNFPFFIASLPDKKWGEKTVLLIEDPDCLINEAEVQRVIDGNLPKYHRPKTIYRVGEFTRTSNGKISRRDTLSKLT